MVGTLTSGDPRTNPLAMSRGREFFWRAVYLKAKIWGSNWLFNSALRNPRKAFLTCFGGGGNGYRNV
jgi:hypothetical protein